MQNKEKYLLNGHNPYEKNYIKEVKDNQYEIISEYDYFSVGYVSENREEILYIDPSGGPMICLGSKIPCNDLDKTVVSITYEDGKFLINTK